MKARLITLIMIATSGTLGWSQEKNKDGQEEKKKAPAGLDIRNPDVSALYLTKIAIHMSELANEGARTGNNFKYQEYVNKVNQTLSDWSDVEVKWPIQVSSVNFGEGQSKISVIQEYAYKNQGRLAFSMSGPDVDRKGFGAGGGLNAGSSLGKGRGGFGDGFGSPDNVKFDEQWAKTLKRGDYVLMSAKITDVEFILGAAPKMRLQVAEYSKYTPPSPKRK